MDIKLIDDGVVFSNGDFQLTENHLDTVAQRLYIRLRTTKFKWFWDLEYGVDWFNKVFGKGKNKLQIDLILKEELRKEKWLDRVISFDSNIDNQTRVYSCNFLAKIKGFTNPIQYYVITNQNGFIITTENNKAITTPSL